MVPVTAEDFARRKRRIAGICTAAALAAIAAGVWIYQRSTDPGAAQDSYDSGERGLKASRYPQAILSFSRAVELKPDFTDAFLRRGRAHASLGETEAAIGDFTRAIQLRPGDSQTYIDRAEEYLELKNFQAAREDCDKAIERDGKIAAAFNLRGMALRGLGDAQKALESFSHAVELAPNIDNYFQRAATYQALGQHEMAVADLDQVIALDRDDAQAYYARALSRRALGDEKGARMDHEQGRILDGR